MKQPSSRSKARNVRAKKTRVQAQRPAKSQKVDRQPAQNRSHPTLHSMQGLPVYPSTGPAHSLPDPMKDQVENALGEDLSSVKVFPHAPEALQLGALAYTRGDAIYFAPGIYDPLSSRGQKIIRHELAHVVQQRRGLVQARKRVKGLPVNDDPGLEDVADRIGLHPYDPARKTVSDHAQKVSSSPSGHVVQMLAPAAAVAMGAAEWIAAGTLGYQVANNLAGLTVGDLTYSLAEMEGTLVPTENNDVNKYNAKHRDRTVYRGTHHLAVWYGFPDSRRLGMKIDINFLYDGHALGSISMGLNDTYDWPAWGGTVNFNITPLGLASRGVSSVRLTVNMVGTRTLRTSRVGNAVFILRGDGDLSLRSRTTNADEYDEQGRQISTRFHYQIG